MKLKKQIIGASLLSLGLLAGGNTSAFAAPSTYNLDYLHDNPEYVEKLRTSKDPSDNRMYNTLITKAQEEAAKESTEERENRLERYKKREEARKRDAAFMEQLKKANEEELKNNFMKDENFIAVQQSNVFERLANLDWESPENKKKLRKAIGWHCSIRWKEVSVPKLLENFNIDPSIIAKFKQINSGYAINELTENLGKSIGSYTYGEEGKDYQISYKTGYYTFTANEFKYYMD